MKTLNLLLRIVLCFTLIHVTLACSQDKKKRTQPGVFRTTGGGGVDEVVDSEAYSGLIAGVVLSNFNNREDGLLEESTKKFATAFLKPDFIENGIGNISSVYQNLQTQGATGVRFSLNACAGGQSILNARNNQADASTANLQIFIVDSFAARQDGEFGVIRVHDYKLTGSSISNQQVTLNFKNDYGVVQLNGSYTQDRQFIVGKFSFDNDIDQSGQQPYYGDLGVFYIPTQEVSKNCR